MNEIDPFMEKIIESGAVVFDGCTFTNTKIENIWHNIADDAPLDDRDVLYETKKGVYMVGEYYSLLSKFITCGIDWDKDEVKKWCYLKDALEVLDNYISKSALIAELERRIEKYTKRGEESDATHDGYGMYWGGVLSCLNELLSLCDTLEVKKLNNMANEIPSEETIKKVAKLMFDAINCKSPEDDQLTMTPK